MTERKRYDFERLQNYCIEVKSTWTYTKQIDIVLLKQKALGYKYEIWVYNNKKEKINCYD